ncbi:MAG: alanine racemase [Desulfobacteraceae bacterium]|nr:MAG: alanine racemase [Desulfobacteraceae bacterium]
MRNVHDILSQKTPLLPEEELRSFVDQYFSLRDEYLWILSKHPPPLYILVSSVLKERAQQFQKAFKKVLPKVSCYFAIKSNNYPDVAKILLKSAFGLDVSSGLELQTAISLGAKDIVFSGPGKTDHELQLAIMNAESVIVLVDSFGELHRLERVARNQKKVVRAGVRLATDTAGLWRKFGIVPKDLLAFCQKAGQCSHVTLCGLQFHTSWNLSPKVQIDFVHILGELLKGMPDVFRKKIEFIDIGGGYWPPQGEWLHEAGTQAGKIRKVLDQKVDSTNRHYRLPSVPIETFAEQVGSIIKKHLLGIVPCRIFLEPGRWICNDAMHLFISVVDKKSPDLIITDAGTNAIGWERFETDYFPILNLTRPSLKERPCDILGSLCTPHDVWGYSYWGDDIQPGDILMVPTQGAYTYSLRQNFIKPLPSVITI